MLFLLFMNYDDGVFYGQSYASIEAIEHDSHSDTRILISYWILLSLIYLFEYPFLKLLQWFQYWHYMKLIMVAFLVIPDFGRSAYVYNHFIQSCIHMNPQAVISRFRNWKNIFVKKEDFTMQAEKYITQNGIEVLEELIASKIIEKSLNSETRTSVPTAEKNEILETNRGRLLMEQKDAKDLEMIEKEQVPEGKQVNRALERLKSNESTLSAMAKTKKMAADTEYGTHPQISASENVQKEWTCAICQLTMPSEANLNSHVQGRKHKAACEALNAKTKGTPVTDTGSGASSQVSASKDVNTAMDRFKSNESTSPAMAKTEKMAADTEHGTHPQISASENVQKEWTCAICQLTMPSEANLNSHLQGRKHKAACEALNTKTKGTPVTDTGRGASSQVSASKDVQIMWTCKICQLKILSEVDLNSHLQGRKHKAACEALNGKTKGTEVTDTGSGASSQVSASKDVQKCSLNSHLKGKKHKAACEALNAKSQLVAEKVPVKKNDESTGEEEMIIYTPSALEQNTTNSHHPKMEHKNVETINVSQQNKIKDVDANTTKVQELQKKVGTSIGMNSSRLRCDMCNAKCTSEGDLASHLRGSKHLAQIQLLTAHGVL
ncbi:zinc finger protein 385B-like [Neltuma alba]|uniref:zinc finger protein 385B-like n=1 Tax=Neltuma alba TaxID=207710 RepID=UPI0010A41FA3|nr:zinc finger protein 385B-like [Prosopis alba]